MTALSVLMAFHFYCMEIKNPNIVSELSVNFLHETLIKDCVYFNV